MLWLFSERPLGNLLPGNVARTSYMIVELNDVGKTERTFATQDTAAGSSRYATNNCYVNASLTIPSGKSQDRPQSPA